MYRVLGYMVIVYACSFILRIFFFKDTAPTENYTYLHTLSLHDALPICSPSPPSRTMPPPGRRLPRTILIEARLDSGFSTVRITRSSSTATPASRSEEHTSELQSLMRISYAGFCLKKKKQHYKNRLSINMCDQRPTNHNTH